jgi:Flp pilus assembly protein TadG
LPAAERGASLVEFAIVMPLLIVLIFGIIEASWAFAQHNDIRHGAREGARLAAVDYGTLAAVGQEVCDRMDLVYPASSPSVKLSPQGADSDVGGLGQITVQGNLNTLTGLLDGFFGGIQLTSTVEFRLEQPTDGNDAQWWNGGVEATYVCT